MRGTGGRMRDETIDGAESMGVEEQGSEENDGR
jgi:hypothetical protein